MYINSVKLHKMTSAEMLSAAGFPNTKKGRADFYKRFPNENAFFAWYNSKKEFGGGLTDGIAFPQQPDASSRRVPYYDKGGFFAPNVMPWNGPIGFYAEGGGTEGTKEPRLYDTALQHYNMLKSGPKEAWSGDPAMVKPDGELNLCVDCINVDYSNPEHVKDVNRLIEEGYSLGTHENAAAYTEALSKFGLPTPVYGSKKPKQRFGGMPEAFPQQPDDNFIRHSYAHGGATDEIAFPQQPTAHINFSAFPWDPTYAMGGGLPGGPNKDMPCMECGGYMQEGGMMEYKEGGKWIQKATASIKRRGTEGVCTGSKFGGPGCPPGSKRYNLAKTFRAMAKKADGGAAGEDTTNYIDGITNDFMASIAGNVDSQFGGTMPIPGGMANYGAQMPFYNQSYYSMMDPKMTNANNIESYWANKRMVGDKQFSKSVNKLGNIWKNFLLDPLKTSWDVKKGLSSIDQKKFNLPSSQPQTSQQTMFSPMQQEHSLMHQDITGTPIKMHGGALPHADNGWIQKMLDYETKQGSAQGTGLPNYGIKKDKWGTKYPEMWADDNITQDEATDFIRKEYLPLVKDYPEYAQQRLVDYAYNTGRDIRDVLMLATGDQTLENVQKKPTDVSLWNSKQADIMKAMQDPAFASKIDDAKRKIYENYWKTQGNPDAYTKTSLPRINMWNESVNNSSPSTTNTNTGSASSGTVNPQVGTQTNTQANTQTGNYPSSNKEYYDKQLEAYLKPYRDWYNKMYTSGMVDTANPNLPFYDQRQAYNQMYAPNWQGVYPETGTRVDTPYGYMPFDLSSLLGTGPYTIKHDYKNRNALGTLLTGRNPFLGTKRGTITISPYDANAMAFQNANMGPTAMESLKNVISNISSNPSSTQTQPDLDEENNEPRENIFRRMFRRRDRQADTEQPSTSQYPSMDEMRSYMLQDNPRRQMIDATINKATQPGPKEFDASFLNRTGIPSESYDKRYGGNHLYRAFDGIEMTPITPIAAKPLQVNMPEKNIITPENYGTPDYQKKLGIDYKNKLNWKGFRKAALRSIEPVLQGLTAAKNANDARRREELAANASLESKVTASPDIYKGMYTQFGDFQPDLKGTPYQAVGRYGGGMYEEGGEYDMTEDEIQQILAAGGQIEYLD